MVRSSTRDSCTQRPEWRSGAGRRGGEEEEEEGAARTQQPGSRPELWATMHTDGPAPFPRPRMDNSPLGFYKPEKTEQTDRQTDRD